MKPPDRPESADVVVARVLAAVDREVASREAAGEKLSESQVDQLVEELVTLALCLDDVPRDALAYYASQGVLDSVQQWLDQQVLDGAMFPVDGGYYQRPDYDQ